MPARYGTLIYRASEGQTGGGKGKASGGGFNNAYAQSILGAEIETLNGKNT